MHLFLFSIPHFPYQAINFPLWLPTPTCSSYCASQGSAGCYTFLLSHLPSHPYGINSPKALVLKNFYFKMIKYVWQSANDQWCLRVIFLQISLMFVYMCVYMVVFCLFTYLTTSMDTYYVPCTVLAVSHVLSHLGVLMFPLLLAIPYFMNSSPRTIKNNNTCLSERPRYCDENT